MSLAGRTRSFAAAFATQLIAIFLVGFLVIALAACGGAFDALGITPTPTPPTPTLTPSPTRRLCPPASSYSSPQPSTPTSRLILILFDPASEPGLIEYENGDTSPDPVAFSYQVLQQVLSPGDHYAFFRLGCRDYACSRLVNEALPSVAAPHIPATPSPQPTSTPPSTPTYTGQTLFERTQIARNYSLTLTPHVATATEMAFHDDCAMMDWVERYSAESTQWAPTQASAQAAMHTQLAADLSSYQARQDELSTPYAANAVLEGLRDASVVLTNECGRYQRCILVIFDDLQDWRLDTDHLPLTPPDFPIDLAGAEVLSVMLRCGDIYQPDCRRVQQAWTDQFLDYGATHVDYRNGVALEAFLTQFLRR